MKGVMRLGLAGNKPLKRLVVMLWTGVTAAAAWAQGDELRQMLVQRYCLSCHAWDKKLVGPAFSAVRARYGAGDAAALVSKVRFGGAGAWGAIPKPADPRISQSEAEYLVAGILGLPLGPSPVPNFAPPAPTPVLPDDPPSVGRVFRLNESPAQVTSDRYMTAQEAVTARNDQVALLRDAARRKQMRTSDRVKAVHCIDWHKGRSGEVGLANKCEVEAVVEICNLDAPASEVLSCEGGGFGLLVLPARTGSMLIGPIVYITGVEVYRRWSAWGCEAPYAPYNTRYTLDGLQTGCARIKGR